MNSEDKLTIAKSIVNTEPDEALRLCSEVMTEEPDSKMGHAALFMAGYIMLEAERFGLAYHIYSRCAEIRPDMSSCYQNMATSLELIDPDKALKLFQKAQSLDPNNHESMANEGLLWLKKGNPRKCIKLNKKALLMNPGNMVCQHNIGLAKLMLKDWSGWAEYSATLGVKGRTKVDYGIPEWDGKAPGKLLVYGEQGVGDEIMFVSMLKELMADHEIVLDTDERLRTLFDRSFDCQVYGTRFQSESNIRLDHPDLDYQVAIGQLGELFRSKGDFPGTHYLVANPDQKIMYRALFDTFPGKKIGIAWTGGTPQMGQHKRSFDVDELHTLLNKPGNTFISLEYNPINQEDMDNFGIKTFPHVTGKGQNIDELASLISQLDMVVTVCTTVVYIAGALGVPCYVLVPSEPSYRYHSEGCFPWYKSVTLARQKEGQEWRSVVKDLADEILPEFSVALLAQGITL
ncbi:MAG: hypothetical protein IH937_03365 [Acidobacteria bacterium]|nr:hypothetical protein [Acidobacteriota bacterium]